MIANAENMKNIRLARKRSGSRVLRRPPVVAGELGWRFRQEGRLPTLLSVEQPHCPPPQELDPLGERLRRQIPMAKMRIVTPTTPSAVWDCQDEASAAIARGARGEFTSSREVDRLGKR